MLKNYAEKQYHAEHARRIEIDQRCIDSFKTGTLLAAAAIALTTALKFPLSGLQFVSFLFGVLGFIALAATFVMQYRVYVGHTYEFISTSEKMSEWIEKAKNLGYSGQSLEAEFENVTTLNAVKCATINANVNDKRSHELFESNVCLGASVVAFAIASLSLAFHIAV